MAVVASNKNLDLVVSILKLVLAVMTDALGLDCVYNLNAVVTDVLFQLPEWKLAALAELLVFLVALSGLNFNRFKSTLIKRGLAEKCVYDVIDTVRVRMRIWVICSFPFFCFRFFYRLLSLTRFTIAGVKRFIHLLLLDRCYELGSVFGGLCAFELGIEEVGWESVNGVHFGRVEIKSDKPPSL